jgi:APA family basic amino acid/polyamine antiporter
MVLRFKDPGRERPFRVPLGPVFLPSLGLLACIYLIFFLPPSSWMRFFGWLLAGLVIYFLYGYRHSRLRNGPPPATFNPASDLPPSQRR